MSPDPLAVTITVREIYDQLVGLTAKVDLLLTQQDIIMANQRDHELRLRNLESTRWPLPAVTILIALAALGVATLPYLTS